MALLQPKKQKYRKRFRGKLKGSASRGTEVSFGDFGLKAMERALITSRQIEAARVALTRYTKKGGRVWIRIFPDKPITSKPSEASMGSGKGEVVGYSAPVLPGRIMFEVGGLPEESIREAMKKASAKLPIKTKVVKRGEI